MDPLVAVFQEGQTRAYDDQAEMTNHFLQELQSDKYKDDVEKLNLSGWIDALKMANDLCASEPEREVAQVPATSRPLLLRRR